MRLGKAYRRTARKHHLVYGIRGVECACGIEFINITGWMCHSHEELMGLLR